MEGRISETLKQYGYSRSKFLESFSGLQSILLNNVVFHSTLVIGSIVLIAAVFTTSRSLTLFSLHPVFMTIGTFCFLAEGIVAYRNNSLLVTLSPIMQHGQRTKIRSIHQTMQTVGGSFLFLGLLAIVSNKIEFKHSIVPMSVHSVLGTVSVLLIVMQIVTGQQKLNQFNISNSKIRRWHGDAGLLVWDSLCLTVFFGLLSFLDLSVFSGLVYLLVIIMWYSVHAQMSSIKSSTAGADEEAVNDSDGPNLGDNDFVDQFSSEPLVESDISKINNRNASESPLEGAGINSSYSSQSDLGTARV